MENEPGGRRRRHVEVSLPALPGEADLVEGLLLDLGALGTSRVCSEAEAPPVPGSEVRARGATADASAALVVTGYFSLERAPERELLLARHAALLALTRGSLPASTGDLVRIEPQPWRDWAAESRRAFRPFSPIPGLTVAPPWEVPPGGPDDLLVIHPGAAFGLGTHATTRACLALIPPAGADADRSPDDPGRGAALDLGTGTGILALRAAQVGYGPIDACDIDPVAVAAAAGNARRNGLATRVAIYAGTLDALRPGRRYALILANILLDPLCALAPALAARLAPDGRLIASGIYAEQRAELSAAMAAAGLIVEAERIEGEWAALQLAPATRGAR